MITELPLLTLLIWTSILGGFFVVWFGTHHPAQSRTTALCITLFCLLLCVPLYTQFDLSTYSMQFREIVDWLPIVGLQYDLGVDGISMPLVILTCFTTLVIILATWRSIQSLVVQYLAALLILQGLLIGVFCSLNAILFYIFWEGTLIPMYLIIGVWGSSNRSYASIKFFMYTFFGSALMLAAFLYLGFKAGDFSILGFYALPLDLTTQVLLFVALLLGFAIKIPMWPVHTWLPHAHTEAPTGGSVILAAVLLKLGAYGFLRFSLPILPDACYLLSGWMIGLSLIAIVYIALVALVQKDMKRLIAYSSISHMGFVTLGCFMIFPIFHNTNNMVDSALGIEGAIVVMISHAFVSGALFVGVGYIYDRLHTREIGEIRGIVNSMPVFSAFFMLFALSNAGLPGTSGFVGEFMVILGSLKAGFWITVCAATTLILGAAYTLWMYKRVIFGEVGNESIAALEDIRGVELLSFVLLAVPVLVIGLYPAPLIDIFHTTISHLLSVTHLSKL